MPPRSEKLISSRRETLSAALRRVLSESRASGDNLLDLILTTPRGEIGILMELRERGPVLHVEGLTVYSTEVREVRGIESSLLRAKSEFCAAAAAAGFSRLTIRAERVARSSSAKPGKRIEITVELTER